VDGQRAGRWDQDMWPPHVALGELAVPRPGVVGIGVAQARTDPQCRQAVF
jgi:hypothetical protein